jgi:hypothetical protein
MALHVFIFLLVLFLLLSLALLWRLSWLHLQPSHSRGRAMRSIAQRLLQPRTPLDCPACRLSCAHSSGMGPAPAPVRPWREVKSRRGAPKRVNTEGFACPNQQCPYFGITDAHIHASFWGWQAWPGRTDPDLSLSVLPHHVHCSAPHSPLPSENPLAPDRSGADLALAEGLDLSAAERVFGYRQATITTWLTRAGEHAQTLHEHCFRNLQISHLQLDELRTRLHNAKQVLWLWLAIDPCTKILPVLHLGLRTQHMAHLLIHSLRELLAPDCLPLFISDGLNVYFYAARGSLWTVARGGSPRAESTPVASGGGPDLWASEKKLPAAQVDEGHACNAHWNKRSSPGCLTRTGLLRAAEHRIYRTGESERPSWGCCSRTPHLGHIPSSSTPLRPPGMVASLLSLCASSRITTSGAGAATSARWQTSGATVPAAYASHGSGKNEPTMDSEGGALLPIAASFRLRASQARCGRSIISWSGR